MEWIAWPEENERLWFEHQDKQWRSASPPSSKVKGPDRSGTFKSAFDHDALLVFGTGGTDEENRWAESKARYDAETFWYRGGGSLEVLRDSDFDPVRTPGRNVILYGNADTNSAWKKLLDGSPVEVRRGQVRVGERTESGDDLGVLMVYPRPGSDIATVGVVAGTGPVGMRLTSRLRYFISGIAYPDLVVLDTLNPKSPTPAVRAWGYFGPEWTVEPGEIACARVRPRLPAETDVLCRWHRISFSRGNSPKPVCRFGTPTGILSVVNPSNEPHRDCVSASDIHSGAGPCRSTLFATV